MMIIKIDVCLWEIFSSNKKNDDNDNDQDDITIINYLFECLKIKAENLLIYLFFLFGHGKD